MSRFLKLSKIIINKNFIEHIDINKDNGKIIIHLLTNKTLILMNTASIETYNTEIEICKNKHLNDYKIITDWIDNNLD